MIVRDIFLIKILISLLLIFSKDMVAYADDASLSLEERNSANKNRTKLSSTVFNKTITPQPNILLEELSESGKIVLMSMIASVCYGIIHDAITINICFDYFRSDMTHHGPQTRRYFPLVYSSDSKILYILYCGVLLLHFG